MMQVALQQTTVQAPTTPTIEAWQVVALLGSIALVVLGAYGTLILQNRGSVRQMRQRLFGAEGDDTDEGFVQETDQRLENIEGKMEQHAHRTHTQLYALDRKVGAVLEVVRRSHDDEVQMPQHVEDVGDVPPPPGDFFRGGSSEDDRQGPRGGGRSGSDD